MTESEKNLQLVSKFSLKPKMLSTSDYFNNYSFQQSHDLQMHLQDSKMNIFNQMNLNVKPSSLLDSPILKDELSSNRLNHVPFGIASVWYV